MDDYELIDAGDGARLERFGAHVVVRPHPGATGNRRAPARWSEADIVFDRERGWSGAGLARARDGWTTWIGGLQMELRPTAAGQVGLFPEHAALLPWLHERITGRSEPGSVLHLFAHTGLVTLALARSGAAVVHVDAARSAIGWARRNAGLNGLDDRPIRWIVDDARPFVAREVRRDRRFDGVVLDPPTYGHGLSGRAWRISTDLGPLLDDLAHLLVPGAFILLTAHATALDPAELGTVLGRHAEVGELRLTAATGATLGLGVFARTTAAS